MPQTQPRAQMKILLLNGTGRARNFLHRLAQQNEAGFHEYTSGREGMHAVKTHTYGIIACMQALSDMSGNTFMHGIRRLQLESVKILLNESHVYFDLTEPAEWGYSISLGKPAYSE